ncbi:hypothetical protein [Streptomyces sp. 3N207]
MISSENGPHLARRSLLVGVVRLERTGPDGTRLYVRRRNRNRAIAD